MKKRFYRWVLSIICLCLSLVAGSNPVTAWAAENTQVTVTKLEELAAPTEFPAKGMMHVQIAKGMHVDADGNATYTYEDEYLTVYVDEDKEVYADLEVLASHLGYNWEYFDDMILLSVNNNKLIFCAGDPQVVYTNYHISSSVHIGKAPFYYEDKMYVPLDAFIQVTGAEGAYYGVNDLGKEALYLVPPQRTVMDDMAEFCENAYSRYAFTFVKDLKYTEEQAGGQAGMANVVQYLEGLLKLDWRSWIMTLDAGWNIDRTSNLLDDTSVDAYMDMVLKPNADALDSTVINAKNNPNILGVVMDVVANSTDDEIKSQLATEISKASRYEWMFNETQQVKYSMAVNHQENVIAKLGRYRKILKAADLVNLATGSINTYCAISDNLSDVDAWSLEGATYINERRPELLNPIFEEGNAERVKMNIDKFKGDIKENTWDRFVADYGWDLLKGAMSFAGIGTVVKLTSDVYGMAADVVSDIAYDALDQADCYMSACFGVQYEAEALASGFSYFDQYVEESKNGEAARSITDDQIRKIFYHVMAACYTTREMGCAGCRLQLEKYPHIADSQELYNQELAEMMGRALDSNVPMGWDYCDLANLKIAEMDHFPNVVFNLIQIQGQILSMEDEKPAKGVAVQVMDEAGEVLAEFETEKDGMFNVAFEVEEADPFADEPLMKNLTLRMKYKRYEELMETVEVQVFQNSRIDGLRIGEETEEILAYLVGAQTVNGETILDIQRITLTEDTWQFDLQEWFDGYSRTYADFQAGSTVSDEIERIVLDDGVSFETVYSKMMGEGTWGGDMMDLIEALDSNDEIVSDGLRKSGLHEAEEIQTYINEYYQINQQNPTFEIKKVNSVARELEPVLVYR